MYKLIYSEDNGCDGMEVKEKLGCVASRKKKKKKKEARLWIKIKKLNEGRQWWDPYIKVGLII